LTKNSLIITISKSESQFLNQEACAIMKAQTWIVAAVVSLLAALLETPLLNAQG